MDPVYAAILTIVGVVFGLGLGGGLLFLVHVVAGGGI